MSEVVVVGIFVAAEGHAETVLAALQGGAASTYEEAGCITYALHRDQRDLNRFVMVERWKEIGDLATHGTSTHVAAMMTQLGAPGVLGAKPSIVVTTPLADSTSDKARL